MATKIDLDNRAGVVKHLEMIQAIIDRMSRSSFLLKGWAVTLLAATLWVSARESTSAGPLAATAIAVIAVFWGLDGYYLRQERLFRELYDKVREQDSTDYSMSTEQCAHKVSGWLETCLSGRKFPTLLAYYLPLALLALLFGFFA